MGSSSSKPEATCDKAASKSEKVLKSVNGDIKTAASDARKGVGKAVTKTNMELSKAGKEVGKAVDTLLGEIKKETKSHTTQVAFGVPLVALIAAGGYYLWTKKPWTKKPWKKSDKPATATATTV